MDLTQAQKAIGVIVFAFGFVLGLICLALLAISTNFWFLLGGIFCAVVAIAGVIIYVW